MISWILRLIFTLPPIVYFVLAPVFAGIGIFAYFSVSDSNRLKEEALARGAPEPVLIEDIATSGPDYPLAEVVVAFQADFDNAIELTKTRRGVTRGRELFVPVYSTTAEDFSGPALAVLEMKGRIGPEDIDPFVAGEGAVGPILLINGEMESGYNSDAREALSGYVTLPGDFYTIRPFANGREDALQKRGQPTNVLTFFLILAALFGGYGYFRKRKQDSEREAEEDDMYHTERGNLEG